MNIAVSNTGCIGHVTGDCQAGAGNDVHAPRFGCGQKQNAQER